MTKLGGKETITEAKTSVRLENLHGDPTPHSLPSTFPN